MKVLLLNGPPRSGKSTTANAVMAAMPSCSVIGFSHHLKRMVHCIYMGVDGSSLDPDHFDATKDQPSDIFFGMSPREAYIHYSERVIKPLHGKEWFGEMFMRAARASSSDVVLVPDSGFRQEAERVVRDVGTENVRLIRVQRDGCTFYDSRSYIDLSDLGVRCLDVVNVPDMQHVMIETIGRIAAELVGGGN